MIRSGITALWMILAATLCLKGQETANGIPSDADTNIISIPAYLLPLPQLRFSMTDGVKTDLSPMYPKRFDPIDMTSVKQSIEWERLEPPVLYDSYNSYLYPLLYSQRSRFSGMDIVGVGYAFRVSDRLSGGLSVYASGAYFGPWVPSPYLNATVSGHMRLKLHERVYVTGMAEMSASRGIDPRIAPGLGGHKSVGVGVDFKITDNVGIGFSHTWTRYDGMWHKQKGARPVSFFW